MILLEGQIKGYERARRERERERYGDRERENWREISENDNNC